VERWQEENEIRKHQGQTRRGPGKEGGESAGVRRIERWLRIDPLRRVKGMGRILAERIRWAREKRTDSRKRTCVVVPESARMGEGVTEHNRGVW
jgi:hypothetical protein